MIWHDEDEVHSGFRSVAVVAVAAGGLVAAAGAVLAVILLAAF